MSIGEKITSDVNAINGITTEPSPLSVTTWDTVASDIMGASKGSSLNKNPYFESGSIGWTSNFNDNNSPNAVPVFSIISDGVVGSGSVYASGTVDYSITSAGGLWLYSSDLIPVDRGRTYTVSAYLRRKSGAIPGKVCFLVVKLTDFFGNNIRGSGQLWWYPASSVAPDTTWTQYSGTFGYNTTQTFPSNACYMQVGIILDYSIASAIPSYISDYIYEAQAIQIEEDIEGISYFLRTAGDSITGALRYSGLTATAGQMNGGTDTPTGTNRLNYEGYLYSTQLYAATVVINTTTPVASTSRLYLNGDMSLVGSNKMIVGNLEYFGGWRYLANGYGWGWRENNAGLLQFISAPNNVSGYGAAATVAYTMTIDLGATNVGFVGIGTVPTSLLHVYQNADAGSAIVIENPNAGTTTSPRLQVTANSGTFYVISHATARVATAYGITLGGYAEIYSALTNGLLIGNRSLDKPIIFGNNNLERMRIAAGGNTGIGTTLPLSLLDVVSGTAHTVGDSPGYAASFTSETPAGQYSTVSIESNSAMAADQGGVLAFGGRYISANTTYANWAAIKGLKTNATSNEYGGYLAFYTRRHGAGSVERMRILDTGYVGIGNSPSTKLHVYHSVSATNVYLTIENGQTNAQAALNLKTAQSGANWILYIPASSSNFVIWNTSDLVTITSAGLLTCNGGVVGATYGA